VKDRASKKIKFLSNDYKNKIHTTRIRRPRAFGGKLRRNLARTAPLLPCARVTLPQRIRTLFKRF
jgi:hypothetical protein